MNEDISSPSNSSISNESIILEERLKTLSVSNILEYYFSLTENDFDFIFKSKESETREEKELSDIEELEHESKKDGTINSISINSLESNSKNYALDNWKKNICWRKSRNKNIGKKIHTMIEAYYNNERFDYHIPRHIFNLFNTFLEFNRILKKDFNLIHCEESFSLIFENKFILYAKPDAIFELINPNNNFLDENKKCFCVNCFSTLDNSHFANSIIDKSLIICRKELLLENNNSTSSSHVRKKRIILFDWKYGRNVFYKDIVHCKGLLKGIMINNKYSSAIVQLNIYRLILESKYDNYKIENMFLLFISPDNQWQILPLIYLKKEFIKSLIVGIQTYQK